MRFPSSRRSFLKASLLTTLAFLHPETTWANFSPANQPSGRLNLYNIHTGEKINTTYRDLDGQYNPLAIDELNWLLRCHHTNEQHPIDLQTLDFLDLVNTRLGSNNEIHIISGFRSPKYNDYLISQGHKVAKHSLHLEGFLKKIFDRDSDRGFKCPVAIARGIGFGEELPCRSFHDEAGGGIRQGIP